MDGEPKVRAGRKRLATASWVGRAPGIYAAEVDAEVVALNPEQGTCYALKGSVAALVWALLAEPARISDVCDTLLDRYAVDRQTCEREVLHLLEDLRRAGLVRLMPETPG